MSDLMFALTAPVVVGVVLVAMLIKMHKYTRVRKCLRAVRDYPLEREFGRLLRQEHPEWTPAHHRQAWRALRQYFYACVLERAQKGRVHLDMPSSIADEAWHVMLKNQKTYERWCKKVLGFALTHMAGENKTQRVRDFEKNTNRFAPGVHRLWHVLEHNKGIKLDGKPIIEYWHAVPLLFAVDASLGGAWQYTSAHIEALRHDASKGDTGSGSGSGSSCTGTSGGSYGDDDASSSSGPEGSGGSDAGSSCSGSSCGGCGGGGD